MPVPRVSFTEELPGRTRRTNGALLGNWKDMARVSLKTCSDTEDGQKFNRMADGRIAVDLSNPPRRIPLSNPRWNEEGSN